MDVALLAQAIQDSIADNRLPTLEPAVFDSNPIHFIEWKEMFMSVIDKQKISADKLPSIHLLPLTGVRSQGQQPKQGSQDFMVEHG